MSVINLVILVQANERSLLDKICKGEAIYSFKTPELEAIHSVNRK
jgi:hypothetical protein